MKILQLTTHLNLGGIPIYLLTLSAGLVERGHEVTVVSNGGEIESRFQDAGVDVVNMNLKTKSELSYKIFAALWPLTRLIKERKIDVIHSHTRVTQVLGQMLHQLTGCHFVTTCHGFYKSRLSRKWFPCWGEAAVAISKPVKSHLEKDFAVPSERAVLVHNGINTDLFPYRDPRVRQLGRNEFSIKEEPVIGIIARLADVKGHDVLIRAMKQVVEKFATAKLLIVGEGKMEGHLRHLTKELGLDSHVIFETVVHKTSEVLPVFDVSVTPSIDEGFGISVLEAQATGLPVVGSRVGGIPSMIKDNVTGLLVEPNNKDELASAIIKLLTDKSLANQLGTQARESVLENFSSRLTVERTEKMYKDVVNGAL